MDDTISKEYEEPEQPMQSIDEIMRILEEATIPADGSWSLSQYPTGSMDIYDGMEEEQESDPELDADSSGEIVYAMRWWKVENSASIFTQTQSQRRIRWWLHILFWSGGLVRTKSTFHIPHEICWSCFLICSVFLSLLVVFVSPGGHGYGPCTVLHDCYVRACVPNLLLSPPPGRRSNAASV